MQSDEETVVKSSCRMCHGVCGVLVHLKDGKVTRVTGDPDCPTSLGYTCAKGRASVELLYHPDRLKYPLKRTGARGENKWQRISWDEALDTTAERILRYQREYGIESIAGMQGTGRTYTAFFTRFMNAMGTPTRPSPLHICYGPRLASSAMTLGQLPICDYYGFGGVYPKCVVVWGCDITISGASDGMCGYQLTRTANRPGTKLIVIDPRKTKLAARADHWLRLRPGTDGALALGMLNVIINEGLYDEDFVNKWAIGFDELRERVQEYPPEKVAEITWIPAKDIRAAAVTYATTKPACIQTGVSLDQNINNFQNSRAVYCLSAVTGNIDVPGGDAFWVPPEGVECTVPRLNHTLDGPPVPEELMAKRIGYGKYRVLPTIHPNEFFEAADSGEPYPVKFFMMMGVNILVGSTYSENIIKALKKIDFIVATEMFMTPTAQYADIVFPAASWLEQDDVADIHLAWCVLARQKVASIGECRDDRQILIDLAHRLGLEKYFPWKTVREYLEWVLRDSKLSWEDFTRQGIIEGKMRYRKYEQEGFATPSGKVELRSSLVENLGYDPLPYYLEPPEGPYSTPEIYEEFPLIMTTGARIQEYFHSEGRQIPSLRQRVPDPLVEINPDTAAKLGIADGDWVWIENPRTPHRITMRAKFSEGLNPSVVVAQHSWWFPEKGPPEYGFRESNVNMLVDGLPYDQHTGSESWRSFLCKVYKRQPTEIVT